MTRMMTLAVVALFAGVALAGCANNNGGGNGATPTGGTTAPTAGGAPDASYSVSTVAPRAGEEVFFNATAAGATDSVAWLFGDGTNGTGRFARHAYAMPGQYVARLDVRNDRGAANNEANLIFLNVDPQVNMTPGTRPPPVALISITPQVAGQGATVTVNASGSYGFTANPAYNATIGLTPGNVPWSKQAVGANVTKYEWTWGDGSNATGVEANHSYAQAGSYLVTLTVTDEEGRTGKAGATVLVLGQAPPVGGFKSKDLYVTATISGPQSFDPGFDYENAGGNVIEQVYETLFGTEGGNTNKIVPVLAAEVPTVENGGIRNNSTVYVIKLKQGVRFHDDTELDANAVKFSLDRAILLNDPRSGAGVLAPILKGARDYRANSSNTATDRQAWLSLEAVKVLEKHTVQITLDRPNAAFFQRLMFYGTSIVSPAAFKACHQERIALWGVCQTPDGLPPPAQPGGRSATRDPWADTHMVGTGPFKLRAWLPGDRVILDRNDAYHGEKAKLKTVIIQYVDDLNTRVLMLRNGDADEIYVPADALDRVRPIVQDVARLTPADSLNIDAFFFNYDVESQESCPTVNGAKDCRFFQDANVRKAFAHAFDYESFFEDVWKGRARSLAGVIPRGMPGYDPGLQPYGQDLQKARDFLAQSKGKDGFSTDCYWNSGNTVRQGACELLKQNVEALLPGKITINSRQLPAPALQEKLQAGEIPFWILGWVPDYLATDNYVEPLLHSRGVFALNQNFRDPEFDAKIDAALRETDPQKQADAYREINRMAVDRYVNIWLDQRTQTHVERTYVQGYYYSPLHSGSPNTGDYAVTIKA